MTPPAYSLPLSDLHPDAQAWHAAVLAAWTLDDPAALALLWQAADCLSTMLEARAILRQEGLLTDSQRAGTGGRLHPAAALLRDTRTAFRQAVAALNLDMEAPE